MRLVLAEIPAWRGPADAHARDVDVQSGRSLGRRIARPVHRRRQVRETIGRAAPVGAADTYS